MVRIANGLTPVVGLAAHVGRGLQRIATDSVVGRVRSLPRTIDDLTPRFLSQIMGRTVTTVSVIGGDAGTSSRTRLALTLTGPLLKTSARRLSDKTDIPLDNGRFINDNYRAVARLIDSPPHTVMLDDAHPGNVYFRNGEAGLLDWQAVRRGHPSRELAYTLVTSMTTADRQAHERQLLDDYRRALASFGGPELDRDDLWERYRTGALYACVAALITAGMGGMQTENIAMEGLRRAVTALDDLDTVPLLEKSL